MDMCGKSVGLYWNMGIEIQKIEDENLCAITYAGLLIYGSNAQLIID